MLSREAARGGFLTGVYSVSGIKLALRYMTAILIAVFVVVLVLGPTPAEAQTPPIPPVDTPATEGGLGPCIEGMKVDVLNDGYNALPEDQGKRNGNGGFETFIVLNCQAKYIRWEMISPEGKIVAGATGTNDIFDKFDEVEWVNLEIVEYQRHAADQFDGEGNLVAEAGSVVTDENGNAVPIDAPPVSVKGYRFKFEYRNDPIMVGTESVRPLDVEKDYSMRFDIIPYSGSPGSHIFSWVFEVVAKLGGNWWQKIIRVLSPTNWISAGGELVFRAIGTGVKAGMCIAMTRIMTEDEKLHLDHAPTGPDGALEPVGNAGDENLPNANGNCKRPTMTHEEEIEAIRTAAYLEVNAKRAIAGLPPAYRRPESDPRYARAIIDGVDPWADGEASFGELVSYDFRHMTVAPRILFNSQNYRPALASIGTGITTFTGLLTGTPPELTYERGIVRVGWSLIMNVTVSVLVLFIAWMGLGQVVKSFMGTRGIADWRELVPRLILAVVAAVTSYWWCSLLVDVADGVSRYIAAGLRVTPADITLVVGQAVLILFTKNLQSVGLGMIPFIGTFVAVIHLGIMAIVSSLMSIFALVSLLIVAQLVMRIVLLNMLIMVSPLGMMMFALPETSGWGRKWISTFMTTLFQHGLQLLTFAMALWFVRLATPIGIAVDVGALPLAAKSLMPTQMIYALALGIMALIVTFKIPSMLGQGGLQESFVSTVTFAGAGFKMLAGLAMGGPAALLGGGAVGGGGGGLGAILGGGGGGAAAGAGALSAGGAAGGAATGVTAAVNNTATGVAMGGVNAIRAGFRAIRGVGPAEPWVMNAPGAARSAVQSVGNVAQGGAAQGAGAQGAAARSSIVATPGSTSAVQQGARGGLQGARNGVQTPAQASRQGGAPSNAAQTPGQQASVQARAAQTRAAQANAARSSNVAGASRVVRPPVQPSGVASAAQPSGVASAQPSRFVSGAQPSPVASGAQPFRAAGAQPSRVVPGQPSDVAGARPSRAAGAQPSRVASGAQPSRAASGAQSSRVGSSGQPLRGAPSQPSDVAGAQPFRAASGAQPSRVGSGAQPSGASSPGQPSGASPPGQPSRVGSGQPTPAASGAEPFRATSGAQPSRVVSGAQPSGAASGQPSGAASGAQPLRGAPGQPSDVAGAQPSRVAPGAQSTRVAGAQPSRIDSPGQPSDIAGAIRGGMPNVRAGNFGQAMQKMRQISSSGDGGGEQGGGGGERNPAASNWESSRAGSWRDQDPGVGRGEGEDGGVGADGGYRESRAVGSQEGGDSESADLGDFADLARGAPLPNLGGSQGDGSESSFVQQGEVRTQNEVDPKLMEDAPMVDLSTPESLSESGLVSGVETADYDGGIPLLGRNAGTASGVISGGDVEPANYSPDIPRVGGNSGEGAAGDGTPKEKAARFGDIVGPDGSSVIMRSGAPLIDTPPAGSQLVPPGGYSGEASERLTEPHGGAATYSDSMRARTALGSEQYGENVSLGAQAVNRDGKGYIEQGGQTRPRTGGEQSLIQNVGAGRFNELFGNGQGQGLLRQRGAEVDATTAGTQRSNEAYQQQLREGRSQREAQMRTNDPGYMSRESSGQRVGRVAGAMRQGFREGFSAQREAGRIPLVRNLQTGKVEEETANGMAARETLGEEFDQTAGRSINYHSSGPRALKDGGRVVELSTDQIRAKDMMRDNPGDFSDAMSSRVNATGAVENGRHVVDNIAPNGDINTRAASDGEQSVINRFNAEGEKGLDRFNATFGRESAEYMGDGHFVQDNGLVRSASEGESALLKRFAGGGSETDRNVVGSFNEVMGRRVEDGGMAYSTPNVGAAASDIAPKFMRDVHRTGEISRNIRSRFSDRSGGGSEDGAVSAEPVRGGGNVGVGEGRGLDLSDANVMSGAQQEQEQEEQPRIRPGGFGGQTVTEQQSRSSGGSALRSEFE